MDKTFDITAIIEATTLEIPIKDADGNVIKTFTSRAMTSDVIDSVAAVETRHSKDLLSLNTRNLDQVINDEQSPPDAIDEAQVQRLDLENKRTKLTRDVVYHQLNKLLVDETGKPADVKFLQTHIPVAVADRLAQRIFFPNEDT